MHLAVSLCPGSRADDMAMFGDALGCYVVIDILRASTVICTALANGASEIIPAAETEEARRLSRNASDRKTLLCGERGGRKIEGFDLGNSPAEYAREVVAGRRLIYASTNGSVAVAGAPSPNVETVVAGFVNLSAAARYAAAVNLPTLIVCAGKLGAFALEDAAGAGALAARLWELDSDLELVNDGAHAAQLLWDHYKSDPIMPLWQSDHGKYLISLGFGPDLAVCGDVDSLQIVPVLRDGRLTAAEFPDQS